MIYCVYHKEDADGVASAAVVKYAHSNDQRNIKMIPMGYMDMDPYPDPDMGADDQMYVCDFAPSEEWIQKYGSQITWIDHHYSSQKTLGEMAKQCGVHTAFSTNTPSACVLAYQFFSAPTSQVPRFLQLISDYDSWANPHGEALDLHYYMLYDKTLSSPLSYDWFLLFDEANGNGREEFLEAMIRSGKMVRSVIESDYEDYLSKTGYRCDWLGHRCLVMNRGLVGSKAFESMWNEEEYDIMVSFVVLSTGIRISLRTTKDEIDVSKIASKYGGGGHKMAAGFVVQDFSLPIFTNKGCLIEVRT